MLLRTVPAAALVCALSLVVAASAVQPPKVDDALADRGLKELDAKDAALHRAVKRASPSIVAVYLREKADFDQPFFDGGPRRFPRRATFEDDTELQAAALGAGVILDKGGSILTCYHLVRAAVAPGSKYALNVRTQGGMLYLVNREDVVAGDPRSDLAVVRITPTDPDAVVPATFGDGGSLFVGQTVLALGNLFGVGMDDGAVSASVGTVSSIARKAEPVFPTSVGADQQYRERRKHLLSWGPLVQVDCRLNLGTSGGALVNTRGEVVGITMALAARTGMETPGGFVLPYDNLVRRVVETLKQGKEMEYGFLGVQPKNYSRAEARATPGMPDVDGVLVQSVVLPQTQRGGLQQGDVVVAIDGQPVRNSNELVLKVGGARAGQTMRFKVVRRKEGELYVNVKLGKYPVAGPVMATNQRPSFGGLRVDYLSLLAEDYSVNFWDSGPASMPQGGVLVTEVEPSSPADAQGISAKSVIVSVNGANLDNPDEFVRLVQNAKAPVKLVVESPVSKGGLTEWKRQTIDLGPAKPKAKAPEGR
jgi:serine protease Do